MNALSSLIVVFILAAVAWVGGEVVSLHPAFGIVVPALAGVVFVVGFAVRVVGWARVPVPFRIPTTCGQQRSLSWIKSGWLESPWTRTGVVARMALEVLLFRSLFRGTVAAITTEPVSDGHGSQDPAPGPARLVFGEQKWLWLAALAFHWSFLFVVLRHLRFFVEPTPGWVGVLGAIDGFFQVGAPAVYLTDVVLLAALAYLLIRRLTDAQVRFISLFQDYFALYLLVGLVTTGVLMRYFVRPDIIAIKQLTLGLVTLAPAVPTGVSPLFFVHLFLLSVLVAYFPFSKLVHMAGVFLSPTRNLANTNRMRRHVNPWNYPVKVHTYEEWEDEFRDKMKAAGLPVEKV
ncbi:MAG: sulfate reduction electron transfer complex DsrMKJOP subunit DsrM [Acidobacteria bacterium]|nr:sulfate reduction electron transfer complex DsrMKJOP subunit DsrM [Acidobacteriota bacterium]